MSLAKFIAGERPKPKAKAEPFPPPAPEPVKPPRAKKPGKVKRDPADVQAENERVKREAAARRLDTRRRIEATLAAKFPQTFCRDSPVPLPINCHRDVHANLPGESLKATRQFLSYWCRRTPYLAAVAADGSERHSWGGKVVEPVSGEARAVAVKLLEMRGGKQ